MTQTTNSQPRPPATPPASHTAVTKSDKGTAASAALPPSGTYRHTTNPENIPGPTKPTVAILEHALHEAAFACGRGAIIGQEPNGPGLVVIPMSCKRWQCEKCAPRLARFWSRRAASAKPERFITVTADPNLHANPHAGYQAIKKAWSAFIQVWRHGRPNKPDRPGFPKHELQYMLVWELHQSGWPHAHILQRGAYIPQAFLKAFWQTRQVGSVVDIRRISTSEKAADYVVKYTGKSAAETKDFLGNHRLIQCSKKFFPTPIHTPTDSRYEGWNWAFTLASPYEVLASLLWHRQYKIASDQYPYAVDLIPEREELPLEAIIDRLDQRPIDKR